MSAVEVAGIPTRSEIITQAVNGDMTRIITNNPPEPLVWAKRLEILRQTLSWLTALTFGGAVVTAFVAEEHVALTVMVVAVSLGLLFVASWAFTIRYAHESRVVLLHKYGVAPNRDGVFELLRPTEPHEDLAATREMIRVYGEPEDTMGRSDERDA